MSDETKYTEADLDLRLNLDFRVYRGKKAWFKNKKYLAAIVDALAALPLFAEFKVAGQDDKEKPFKTVEQVKSLIALGRAVDVCLRSYDDEDEGQDCRVVLKPGPDSFDLMVFCEGAVLAKHRATILDQYIALTLRTREALADVAGLFTGYAVPWFRNLCTGEWIYPRPRPPRSHPGVPVHSVVDFIDVRFHASKHPDAEPKEARALAKAKAPAAVRRTSKDDFVVVQWAKNAQLEELQRGASEHEVWFAAQVETLVDGRFNELGDRYSGANKLVPASPLTLYSPKWRVGYKAIVVSPDGTIEKTAWAAAKKVLKNKTTDDGFPVDELILVVPTRELTFVIAEKAKAAGFSEVVYPRDEGEFWNPDPPGVWRTPVAK